MTRITSRPRTNDQSMSMQHLTIATEVLALAEADHRPNDSIRARYGVALYVLSGALLVSLVAMVVLTSWAPGWASGYKRVSLSVASYCLLFCFCTSARRWSCQC